MSLSSPSGNSTRHEKPDQDRESNLERVRKEHTHPLPGEDQAERASNEQRSDTVLQKAGILYNSSGESLGGPDSFLGRFLLLPAFSPEEPQLAPADPLSLTVKLPAQEEMDPQFLLTHDDGKRR